MNAIAFPIVATHTTTPCSLAHATTWSFNVASGCCFARARSHSIFILCLRAAGRRSGITPPVSRNKRSTRLTVDVLTEKCLAVEAYVDLAFRRWCSTIRVRRSLLSRGVGIGRLNQLFYGVSTTFFGSHQLVTGLGDPPSASYRRRRQAGRNRYRRAQTQTCRGAYSNSFPGLRQSSTRLREPWQRRM